MKKIFFVLPIVALSLFAVPAVSFAQGNINPGNTQSDPLPAENADQGDSGAQNVQGN